MNRSIFEEIKRINKQGYEFWFARELAKILGYTDFGNFENVIEKAKTSCKNSGQDIDNHFGDVTEMVAIGSKSGREFPSYMLSRYACYMIAQNADPRKIEVAMAQTYFAIKTREKEVEENMIEDNKRVFLRNEMKKHNTDLASAAKDAGVVEKLDYAIFQNFGYQGLYGGMGVQDIHKKKGLKKSQKILDHMNSEELAANLFRATQTEAKLKRDKIKGKMKANELHKEVGKMVRKSIREIGGTMPEDLPAVDSISKATVRLKEQGIE